MKLLQKRQLPSNNFATKTDVVRLFNFCFKYKENEFNKKNNSLLHIIITVLSGILVIMVEFFPSMVLQTWFGKIVGAGILSAVMVIFFKSLFKTALSKTGFITNIIDKILSPIKKTLDRIFKKKMKK